METGNFCADTPARIFILGTKYFTGYFGCGRCNTEGEYIENRICFPEIDAVLRTDETFQIKTHEEFHKRTSILESLNIKCISQVPLDTMHLLYQGVVKKMLSIILKGPLKFRLSTQQQRIINEKLNVAKQTQPKEFSRRIRPISEFSLFKATELRTFLLYTGMVVFNGTIPKEMYDHFITLCVAIRLLSHKTHFKLKNTTAEKMLCDYVLQYGSVFEEYLISFNIHNLIHLAKEVLMQNAPCDSFGCWKFESYNVTLKQFGKKQNCYLQQAYKRTIEVYESARMIQKIKSKCSKSKIFPYFTKCNENDILNVRIYDEVQFKHFTLNSNGKDKWCITNDEDIVEFDKGVEKNQDNKLICQMVRGRRVLNKVDYFQTPIKSSSLGIYKCENYLLSDCKDFYCDDIKSKMFCIKDDTTGSLIFISMIF